MNTNHAQPLYLSASPLALTIDRWIYVFTAAFFIVITLTGFIPDSVERVEAIMANERPPFPLVAHVHAVSMGSFLLFLFAQAALMATQRRALHMRFGQLAFLLVPVMVAAGWALAVATYHAWWDFMQNAAPEAREELRHVLLHRDNILLLQLRIGVLFPACLGLALRARRTDSGLHKRMMLLATAIPLEAAFARMHWIPSFLSEPLQLQFYPLLALAPLLLWDLARNRTLHKAYWIWLALYLPVSAVVYALWDTPGWHTTARWLMGV